MKSIRRSLLTASAAALTLALFMAPSMPVAHDGGTARETAPARCKPGQCRPQDGDARCAGRNQQHACRAADGKARSGGKCKPAADCNDCSKDRCKRRQT